LLGEEKVIAGKYIKEEQKMRGKPPQIKGDAEGNNLSLQKVSTHPLLIDTGANTIGST
jgi:hypothetical protein